MCKTFYQILEVIRKSRNQDPCFIKKEPVTCAEDKIYTHEIVK